MANKSLPVAFVALPGRTETRPPIPSTPVDRRNVEPLRSLGDRRVLIAGIVQGYHVSFDLRRFHHLRLTPYCVIEPVI